MASAIKVKLLILDSDLKYRDRFVYALTNQHSGEFELFVYGGLDEAYNLTDTQTDRKCYAVLRDSSVDVSLADACTAPNYGGSTGVFLRSRKNKTRQGWLLI